jgi:PilZ domain
VITSKEWKYWFRTLGYPQKERAPRRNPTSLAAMHGSTSSPVLGHIKVISSTGLYLQTKERWPIGEIVSITLQKEGPAAHDSEFQVEIQARVASHGEDGVGLGFVLPSSLNANLWEHLIDHADSPIEEEETQFIFRTVRAILFLYRLCPSSADRPIYALTGELDEFRTKNMLEIALMAEKMLAADSDTDKMRAHPHIVGGVLRDGSWQDDDLMQRLWAGLLVSSCDEEGTDESNMDLVELLVQVTTSQARILVEGCRRADEQQAGENGRAPAEVIITKEEMIRITDMYDLYRNATDIAYLHGYGLIANNFDFSSHGTKTDFDIAPTQLGMRLYKTCRGQQIDHLEPAKTP